MTLIESHAIPEILQPDIPRAVPVGGEPELWIADEDIAEFVVLCFKAHPHISNVMTHIGRHDWQKIHTGTYEVFATDARWSELSLIGQNIVQLLWAERGVTGRTLKPYIFSELRDFLCRDQYANVKERLAGLCSNSYRSG